MSFGIGFWRGVVGDLEEKMTDRAPAPYINEVDNGE